ncbi:MAG: hypothetical protein ACKO7Z_02680 [Cyanobacteriota bacterium]
MFLNWNAGVAKALAGLDVVVPLEAEITTADGSVRLGLFTAVLLGDTEMVISVMDITAWRQAERQLREAHASLAETALAIT